MDKTYRWKVDSDDVPSNLRRGHHCAWSAPAAPSRTTTHGRLGAHPQPTVASLHCAVDGDSIVQHEHVQDTDTEKLQPCGSHACRTLSAEARSSGICFATRTNGVATSNVVEGFGEAMEYSDGSGGATCCCACCCTCCACPAQKVSDVDVYVGELYRAREGPTSQLATSGADVCLARSQEQLSATARLRHMGNTEAACSSEEIFFACSVVARDCIDCSVL